MHSAWNNEMRTDFFEECDSAFSDGTHYILSPTVEIPDTWERGRYVYVPIHDSKEAAEEEALRTKKEYEKALEEYELAQSEIMHLSEESKTEIVLEDYEYFICNLKTLTPRELCIYELYIEGKSTAEIAAVVGIKENTVKYHSKNIYSKLGISSRKQLLRFASLKQHQDKKRGDTLEGVQPLSEEY